MGKAAPKKDGTVKLSISMNTELLKRVDEKKDDMFMSRSAFINMAVNQFLTQQEILENTPKLSLMYREALELIKSKGVQQELERKE